MKMSRFARTFILCFAVCNAISETFNFVIPSKSRECFFEDFKSSTDARKIDAFVLSGGSIDVLLTIHGPLQDEEVLSGSFENPIFKEQIDGFKESESETQTFTTEFTPETSGTYGICLDNRNSRLKSKTVQLGVSPLVEVTEIKAVGKADQEEVDAEKLLESLNALSAIQTALNKIQLQQLRDRHRLDLHSEANETNYNNVLSGSVFETAIFIGVAVFQIIFVRRWFTSKSAAKSAASWA